MAGALAATTLSIVGHPAPLMPTTFLFCTIRKDASPGLFQMVLVSSLLVAVITLAFSWRQVHLGQWSHIDAPLRHERRQINLFLIAVLFGVSLTMFTLNYPRILVLGASLSGAIVALGHVLRSWLKMSLHASFAVFAASFLWPDLLGTLAMFALAVAIGWSRTALSRHNWLDVGVALMAGAVAGVLFNLI